MSTYNIGMNTLRNFVSRFGELWQKYKPLDAIRSVTTQQIPNLMSQVNPYQKIITTMKKGYDKLKKMVVKDNIVHENQNNNDQTSSTSNKYEPHQPAEQFKNIAYTYKIREKLANRFTELKLEEQLVLFMGEYSSKVNSDMYNILNMELDKLNAVKYTTVAKVIFYKKEADIYIESHMWSFKVENATLITNRSEIQPSIEEHFEELQNKIDAFIRNGSGWIIQSIDQVDIHIAKYTPLTGSSYLALPNFIESKKACINVKNEDNRCFAYAVTSAIYPVKKNPQRPTPYNERISELNMEGIVYPVEIDSIHKFEKQNPPYGINVFIVEENEKKDKITPILICKDKSKTIINLLLITEGEKKHYVWIKNFSRLMSTKVSKDGHELYWCYNCLSHFTTQEILQNHQESGCYDNPCAKIVLPVPNSDDAFIEYKESMMKKQLKVPFIIYADFEALTKEIDSKNKYQEHIGCSHGYQILSVYEEFSKEYKAFRGEGAINKCIESLLKEESYIVQILNRNKPMIITAEQEKEFKNATHCHICNKELKNDRVRDHDHINGKYRGAAHSKCNINYNYKNVKIPVVFHNLRGYDSHLIMQEIGKYAKEISVIPNTTEKYISFTIKQLVFIDSLQFLGESLEKLVECLLGVNDDHPKSYFIEKNIHLFSNLLKGFKHCTREQVKLLVQKGVYPYDYMNCWEKFEETKLPPIEEFYSQLNGQNIEQEDYERAKRVFNEFKCKDLGDYHDLYLKTDVLLLADVFENYRNVNLRDYKLDPAHFYTAPGLSWCAMLKHTGKRIELFNNTQIDMLNIFEQNKRGGVCMISKRYAEANNKYMKNYDEKKPSTYIIYLDANNLYGWGMSQYLPIGNFANEDVNTFNEDRIMKWADDAKRGLYIVFDVDYPDELHDSHNCYPCAPENIKGEYSPFLKDLMTEHKIKEDKSLKLIPNLYNKTKYGAHYRLLKFYLSHGLVLKKIHTVISFDQEPWLESYIDLNSRKRAQAKTDFEKNSPKLMNCSIYGKTCENIRNRRDIKLCTTAKKAQRLFNKPKYKDHTIFKSDELIAVEMAKTKIKYDKPVYLGTCILDLSKLLMYEFHYDFIKPLYGEKVELLFTDTDSLCYEIQTEDIYEDMLKHKDMFDFSDYPKNHKCYDETNKKVIGKFKDEAKGKIITEFIGLRPKLYSYTIEGDKDELKKLKLKQENKKGKGIKETVIKNKLTHENYRKALFGEEKSELIQNVSFNIIKSKNHVMNSVKVDKIGLSCMDPKRWVWDNNKNTYAIGHYKTRINNVA